MRRPALSTAVAVVPLLLWLGGCDAAELKLAPARDTQRPLAGDSGAAGLADADGDGSPAGEDCDDRDPAVHPGATERCNDQDDDCDGDIDEELRTAFHPDLDGDGHGDPDSPSWHCAAPSGMVADAGDCNDRDPAVHPGAPELCNDQDDDCDGDIDEDAGSLLYADADGDGWGDAATTATGCPGAGWALVDGDCDDGDAGIHPGMASDRCDGRDTDCDGDVDEDSKAGWALLTVDTNAGHVYEIDPATAALSRGASVSTDAGINSMDVSENGVSIVHVYSDGALATFDACTGSTALLPAHGAGGIGDIGFGPSGRLFGIGGGDTLYEFDLGTGAATAIGPLGIDIGNSGLAWDCTSQTMFGADGRGDRVFAIDLATGAATDVRETTVPFGSVGLEYDRRTGLLLAATGTALYTVDPATGASTLVGPLATSNVDDLAWHPTCP